MTRHPPETSFFSNLEARLLTEQNLPEAASELRARAGQPLQLREHVEMAPPRWPHSSRLWRAAVGVSHEATFWGEQRLWAPSLGESEAGRAQDHLRIIAVFLWLLSLTGRP